MFTIVVGIIALILYFSLLNRIETLEELVKGLSKGNLQQAAPSPAIGGVTPERISEIKTDFGLSVTPGIQSDSSVDKFLDWLKDDWPLKSGVLLH